MKNLITIALSLAVMTIASHASGVTIAGIEDITLLDGSGTVMTSNHEFITASTTASGVVPANDPSIAGVLSDGDTLAMTTYVLSIDAGAYIDISFGGLVTGLDQLVFFFAGGLDPLENVIINFDLDINADGVVEPAGMGITPYIPLDSNGLATTVTDVDGFTYTLTAATVDLSAFGLASSDTLGTFRIYLGNDTYPLLSGVGYITAVPLPLPMVLFASGLGVLGLFGRRKTL